MFTQVHHTTPEAQGTKQLLLPAASQDMKIRGFILPTTGFFTGFSMEVLPVWHEWGFTGHLLRNHALKTIWSDPGQDELLTKSLKPLQGWWVFPSKAQNFSMACISCPMLCYISSSHRRVRFNLPSHVPVQLAVPHLRKSAFKSLGSTASPLKDMVTA